MEFIIHNGTAGGKLAAIIQRASSLAIAGLLTTAVFGNDLPDVESAIPTAVKAIAPPAAFDFRSGNHLAAGSTELTTQDHLQQGLNHLNGGWEFEASRHFAAAMRKAPECLLAHWGMLMCLLTITPETHEARANTLDRMLSLVTQGKGSDLERGYAMGLIKHLDEGPASAAAVFKKVANQFPDDFHSKILAAIFSRGGFDETGEASPSQKAAENKLLKSIEADPENPALLNAFLFIHADAPDLSDYLHLARRLVRLMPDYPPYYHLWGHYEWRCGNHTLATCIFARSAKLYQQWMTEQTVSVADCPEWLKSEGYRLVALTCHGDAGDALDQAVQLAATSVPSDRSSSPGNRHLLWEMITLPSVLVLRDLQPDRIENAASLLPPPDELIASAGYSTAHWWINGLRLVIETKRLIAINNLDSAREVISALDQHMQSMAQVRNAALAGGELFFWSRYLSTLEMLTNELRGDMALSGSVATRGAAYNWFSAAVDRQQPSPLLMPPPILSPIASRLGEYHLITENAADAVEAYKKSLLAFPNHQAAMFGLQKAFEANGNITAATEVSEKIKSLEVEFETAPHADSESCE